MPRRLSERKRPTASMRGRSKLRTGLPRSGERAARAASSFRYRRDLGHAAASPRATLLAGSIGRCRSIPRSCGRVSTRSATAKRVVREDRPFPTLPPQATKPSSGGPPVMTRCWCSPMTAPQRGWPAGAATGPSGSSTTPAEMPPPTGCQQLSAAATTPSATSETPTQSIPSIANPNNGKANETPTRGTPDRR